VELPESNPIIKHAIMKTKTPYEKLLESRKKSPAPWHRVPLLFIFGYEAVGCLIGGFLLVLGPDGHYMDMPVNIMHGFFTDFLIPGMILFALGSLNTFAFFSLLSRSRIDWIIAFIALCGMTTWFAIEIIILHEIHWLHAMWGLPVLLGWTLLIPLIIIRNNKKLIENMLLSCGIGATLWYALVAVFMPLLYRGYSSSAFTVSELSAIGAPTRIWWVVLILPFPLLLSAFGWGVLQYEKKNPFLRVTGNLFIAYGILNLYWPPMHQRQLLAIDGNTLTDSLHIAWTIMTLIFNISIMGFGAAALNKRFRFYTLITFIIFLIFGILSFVAAEGITRNQPTPYIGIWERINIAAFLLWIIVFAVSLHKTRFPSFTKDHPDSTG
jgi:hypothetical protein